jgi:hypothetical protein
LNLLKIILINIIFSGTVIGSLLLSNEDPRTFVIAYFFYVLLRFCSVDLLTFLYLQEWGRSYAIRFSSRPPQAQEPTRSLVDPNDREIRNSEDLKLSSLIFIWTIVSFFNSLGLFVMPSKKWAIEAPLLSLGLGLIYAFCYWSRDLVSQSLLMDFEKPRAMNLYNNFGKYPYDIAMLSITAILGCAVQGALKNLSITTWNTAWIVPGVLLGFRFLQDVLLELKPKWLFSEE